MWAKLLAFLAYLCGRNAGVAQQQQAEQQAVLHTLEQRGVSDAAVDRASDDANRQWLRDHAGRR